jgi:hypothetical protein
MGRPTLCGLALEPTGGAPCSHAARQEPLNVWSPLAQNLVCCVSTHSRTRMSSHNGTLRPFRTCPRSSLIYARTKKLLMRRTCNLYQGSTGCALCVLLAK